MSLTVKQQPVSQFFSTLLPGIYISVVLLIDWLSPMVTITPFFVVLGLLFMAVKCRPSLMIPWAVIYTAIVCCIYLVPAVFELFSGNPYHDDGVIHSIRAATYVIVGGLSCYLCMVLNRLRKSKNELNNILKKIPWPIVISDCDGRILYWNESMQALLPALGESNGSHSYFDLLAAPDLQGRTIASYINRLEQNEHVTPLELSVKGQAVKGYTQVLEWTNKDVLLTILMEEGSIPMMFPK